ncbi:NOX5 oxidase, partial [Aphelocoma coerulescens]|nr:NOX5 oxidase [Aphelocoma coerulescens]
RAGSVCWAGSRAMGAAADAEWLRWVTKQFGNIAGKDREISLEEFKSALQVKESFFAERFFALFDSDGSGSLSLEELLGSLRLLLHGNSTEKLCFLFRVYDVDGERRESRSGWVFQDKFGICWSGSIDAEELRVVLRECLRESSMALPEERLGALSQALLQAADRDHSGSITFPELREQLEAFPEILENLSISAASWLRPPAPTERRLWPRCFSRDFWRERLCCFSRELRGPRLCCLGAWAAVTALLVALGALRHRERGPALALARGCGHGLNFNCALLAALMLRRSLTRLRSTPLAELLPLELHVRGHELVAYLGRGGAELCPLSPGLAQGPGQVALGELLRRPRPGAGGVAGTAPQSGLALLALLLAMLVCSRPCVRRGGHFEVFYWSHLSYISVWFLLLLHGPHFWKWFLIPGSLFFLEKVLGWVWRRAGDLRILEANLLPSKVTHLVIQRPKSFRFQPGDYVFLNIPAIAAYEWHPFSISSAPEQPETLWLHIRALGQWTNKLYEYFQQLELHGPEPNPPGKSRRERRSRHWEQVSGIGIRAEGLVQLDADLDLSQCYLDGPYGTPSRRIFTSEHAVLIGAGIGITPFASILQSIMFRYRRRKQSCPSCHFSWSEERRDEEMTLRKVDFIWITRDQQHLQWFLSLLSKLETEQAELEPGGKFLELHLYMTSALGKGDMKALGLQVALDLLAAKENRDSITGLRTRTQPGRPDWAKVFGKVAAEQRGKVRVFFCGSPGLARLIRGHCRSFGFRFSKENF